MISHKSLSRVGWLSGGSACGSDGGSSGSWGCGSRWSLSCSSCCTSVSSCRYRCGWHSLRLVLPSSALCPLLRSPLLWSAPLFTAMWSIMGPACGPSCPCGPFPPWGPHLPLPPLSPSSLLAYSSVPVVVEDVVGVVVLAVVVEVVLADCRCTLIDSASWAKSMLRTAATVRNFMIFLLYISLLRNI